MIYQKGINASLEISKQKPQGYPDQASTFLSAFTVQEIKRKYS